MHGAARRRLLQLAGHYTAAPAASGSSSSSTSSSSAAAAGQQQEVIATVSPQGGVGTITLNRPRALNALNLPMVRALDGVLKQWAADPKVRKEGRGSSEEKRDGQRASFLCPFLWLADDELSNHAHARR